MNTYKVLGQLNPSANTLSDLYTAPTSTVCSTLAVCNQGLTTTIRVAVRVSGLTLASYHYIIYDTVLNSNDSMFLTLGISLAATDILSVYAGTSNVSFSLFGTEVS